MCIRKLWKCENTKKITTPITTAITNIPGKILWLDAQDPNNTGVLPTNGTIITTWKDKSGNGTGKDAAATGSITLNTSGFNGLPAMVMSTTKWFTGAVSNTNNTLTIFGVCAMDSSCQINARIISLAQPGLDDYNNNNYMGFLRSSGNGFQGKRNNISIANEPSTANSPYLFETWYTGTTNFNTVQDGGTVNTISSIASSNVFAITSYGIGTSTNTSGTTAHFSGLMAEVLVYNTALTDTQRQLVEGYLSWKWNLQAKLPTSHPYYSAAPV